MDTSGNGPVLELPAQLVTGSTFGAMFGKGRTVGIARLDPSALTFVDKKGSTVLTQDLRGITATEFKRMTGAISITGDTSFKLYPPMESSGSDVGDIASAVTGVASTAMFHDALTEAIAFAQGQAGS